MLSLSKRMCLSTLAAAVCLASSQARQQQPPPPPTSTPVQPVSPVQPIANPNTNQPDSSSGPASPLATSPNVVTGGFSPTAAWFGEEHSQVTYGFQVGEVISSNFGGTPNTVSWNDVTNFGGHLDLSLLGRTSTLTLHYAGGGMLDAQASGLDSTYHAFEVSESLQFRRWVLRLDDSFSYLPQSSFGFVPFGVTIPNLVNQTLLDPSISPSQSILTSQSSRLSNVFIAQAQIQASQRTTFTFNGGYGLLDYTTPGFFNPTNINLGFGYNYALGPRDTLGVSYTFNNFGFNGTNSTTNGSSFQVTYGHNITSRLLIQAGGGPTLIYFKPMGNAPSTGSTSFGISGGLSYQMKGTVVTATFFRGVTGGAGILLGANGNTGQIGATHQWGRKLNANATFGVSYNQALPQVASQAGSSYTSFYAGTGLTYKFTGNMSFFASYNYTRQTTSGVVCTGVACAAAGTFDSMQVWVGMGFESRPNPIR
jgi:hypothetical protein